MISHYNTFYFLRYALLSYVKCLFINIQKQQDTLTLAYFLRNLQSLRVNNSRILMIKNDEIFGILFLYESKNLERFSNLHQCTFNKRFFLKKKNSLDCIRKENIFPSVRKKNNIKIQLSKWQIKKKQMLISELAKLLQQTQKSFLMLRFTVET